MSTLYLVATPIGNLSDFSQRAIDTLKEVDYIACEDTRTSSKLLRHYLIEKPTFSFHLHNEHFKKDYVKELLDQGNNVALISDAGTPGISDPGYLAVQAALEGEHDICSIPGANAAIVALSASGLPCDTFTFEGFLPHKKGRKTKLEMLATEHRTMVLYESPYRVAKLINEICTYFGEDRKVVVARELTKKFEEFKRGTAAELKAYYEGDKKPKGEFVVIIEGAAKK